MLNVGQCELVREMLVVVALLIVVVALLIVVVRPAHSQPVWVEL